MRSKEQALKLFDSLCLGHDILNKLIDDKNLFNPEQVQRMIRIFTHKTISTEDAYKVFDAILSIETGSEHMLFSKGILQKGE